MFPENARGNFINIPQEYGGNEPVKAWLAMKLSAEAALAASAEGFIRQKCPGRNGGFSRRPYFPSFFCIWSGFMAQCTAVSAEIRPARYSRVMDSSMEIIPSAAEVWMTESI